MKRTACLLVVALIAGAAGAPAVFSAGELKAWLSAPATATAGHEAVVEALIVNGGDAARTFTWAVDATGLTLEPGTATRRAWVAPNAFLPVRWKVKAGAPAEATFSLSLDGKPAGGRTIRIVPPRQDPVLTHVAELGDKELALALPGPGPGKRYEVEVTVTAGARGELVATLDGLRHVTGFTSNAVVLRSVVPAALAADGSAGPDLLAALRRPSGGWGVGPADVADVRSTSWALFWLGRVKQADDKSRADAIAWLRKRLPKANAEMQARILTALAAMNEATPKDLALLDRADPDKLSPAGRLLAVCSGACLPMPVRKDWPRLNVLETSVLILCLARGGAAGDGLPLLPRLVELRGAQPRFDTHEAALYALALSHLAKSSPDVADAQIAVRLGDVERTAAVGARKPFVPLGFTAGAPAESPKVTISKRGSGRVFIRVVVRPAE